MVGTDEAREAKIEETLRKMGIQGSAEVRAKAQEESKKSVGDQITSIFDVSGQGMSVQRYFISSLRRL